MEYDPTDYFHEEDSRDEADYEALMAELAEREVKPQGKLGM